MEEDQRAEVYQGKEVYLKEYWKLEVEEEVEGVLSHSWGLRQKGVAVEVVVVFDSLHEMEVEEEEGATFWSFRLSPR